MVLALWLVTCGTGRCCRSSTRQVPQTCRWLGGLPHQAVRRLATSMPAASIAPFRNGRWRSANAIAPAASRSVTRLGVCTTCIESEVVVWNGGVIDGYHSLVVTHQCGNAGQIGIGGDNCVLVGVLIAHHQSGKTLGPSA